MSPMVPDVIERATFEFRGMLAQMRPRIDWYGLEPSVTITMTCDVQNAESVEANSIRVGLATSFELDGDYDNTILEHMLTALVRRCWLHELDEGFRRTDGTYVLRDPHPERNPKTPEHP